MNRTTRLRQCWLEGGRHDISDGGDPPVDPATLRVLVLTHAHLDRCGYLPRMVKDGFAGRVLSTPETAPLAAIVLTDSAHMRQRRKR